MIIKVGNYELGGNFKNKTEAKKAFLKDFPLVSKNDLDVELSKHFKNVNQSNNAKEEDSHSDKQHSKNSERSTR